MHIILAFLALAAACHPECVWFCDSPICPAVCSPVCQNPDCFVQCTVPWQNATCSRIGCNIDCPEDQCESDSCPVCEIRCSQPSCDPSASCEVLCAETQCAWECSKPTDCPRPTCELQCERPACEAGAPGLSPALAASLLVGALLLLG